MCVRMKIYRKSYIIQWKYTKGAKKKEHKKEGHNSISNLP